MRPARETSLGDALALKGDSLVKIANARGREVTAKLAYFADEETAIGDRPRGRAAQMKASLKYCLRAVST